MTNGYTGTGISIFFYLILSILMPFVHMLRSLKRNSGFNLRFVMRHFSYGILIIIIVLVGIAYITAVTGLRGRGQWHTVLNYGAWSTTCLLVIWVLTPLILQSFRRFWYGEATRRDTGYKYDAPYPPKTFSRLPHADEKLEVIKPRAVMLSSLESEPIPISYFKRRVNE